MALGPWERDIYRDKKRPFADYHTRERKTLNTVSSLVE